MTDSIEEEVVWELSKAYPDCVERKEKIGLQKALNRIYDATQNGFIFILDEWDCVFRIKKIKSDFQKRYLDFLRYLFKGAIYVDLVYMTGILPIKKYGEHSALNMFTEYSMTSPKDLIPYFGFTREEVLQQCKERGVDFLQMEKWYDGYLVGRIHIYNPKSVNDALVFHEFQSYWSGTETYEELKKYIEQDFDSLKEDIICMLGGGTCKVDVTSFLNDMATFRSKDDVLTLLVHLGYLTYDTEKESVRIPNLEVKQEFMRTIKNTNGWAGLMHSLDRSMELLERTWAMDETAVAKGIGAIHEETASLLEYNRENALVTTLYIAYYSASTCYARPIREFPSGKGFADLVYIPLRHIDRTALVVELKWGKTAEGAIGQIRNKNYASWIADYCGDILLVGINYRKKDKVHECRIERYVKE